MQYEVCLYSLSSINKETDIELTLYILKDLADRQYLAALRSLGLLYLYGEIVKKDLDLALMWFKKGEQSGSVECFFELAQIYDQGLGVPIDQNLAGHYYQKSAEAGDFRGQHHMGLRLILGDPVKDDAKAFGWFLKAAEQNFGPAQYVTAVLYETGTGTKKDIREAARRFEQLAEGGLLEAQLRLTSLCVMNPDIPTWTAKALKWAEIAASSGSSEAQNTLGKIYALGLGVPADPFKAMELFKQSAEQGYGLAMLNLLYIYRHGFSGLDPDPDQVVSWVMKGYELGYPPLKYVLGLLYREGTVLEKNEEQARRIFSEFSDSDRASIQRLLASIMKEFAFSKPDPIFNNFIKEG
ncbi:MAG: sel1 repeat family protein [Deltaproteobacteria bacterium]|nr:sel1 repeat family protein [Deltaproteobacteria bacterium]